MTVALWLCGVSFPEFLCSAVRDSGDPVPGCCASRCLRGLAAVGLGYLAVVLWVMPRAAQQRVYPVEEVKDSSGEVAGYLATYLVPFVTVASPSAADVIGYCILALVVLVIFMRSDLAQINPALYLLARRVVSITAGGRSWRAAAARAG